MQICSQICLIIGIDNLKCREAHNAGLSTIILKKYAQDTYDLGSRKFQRSDEDGDLK